MKLPLSDLDPHPFVARDVQQEDWLRFVGDIVTVGQLTPMEDIPPVLWCCLAGLIGLAIGQYFRRKFKKDKAVVVCGMIDLWNEHFFHPRNMEVFLARGQQRLNGDSNSPVPGLLHIQLDRPAAQPAADDKAKSKEDGDQVKGSKSSWVQISDGDKTYRLFVVSL